jgi:addiction module HigA family antidote
MTIPRSDLDHIDFSDIEDPEAPRVGPIHPGEILRVDWLEPMGITPYRAAMDIGVPPNRLTTILAGDRAITADTAMRLAQYFGNSAEFWLGLQLAYDLESERLAHGEEIARVVKRRNAA